MFALDGGEAEYLIRSTPQCPPKILQSSPAVKVEASRAAWLEARA